MNFLDTLCGSQRICFVSAHLVDPFNAGQICFACTGKFFTPPLNRERLNSTTRRRKKPPLHDADGVDQIVQPPSTGMFWPVTYVLRSVARNAITPLSSQFSPMRASGIIFSSSSRNHSLPS